MVMSFQQIVKIDLCLVPDTLFLLLETSLAFEVFQLVFNHNLWQKRLQFLHTCRSCNSLFTSVKVSICWRDSQKKKSVIKTKSRFETMFFQWTRNKWIHRVYVLKSWIKFLFECALQRFSISTRMCFHFFQRPYWKITHCPRCFFTPFFFSLLLLFRHFFLFVYLCYSIVTIRENVIHSCCKATHEEMSISEWFVSFCALMLFCNINQTFWRIIYALLDFKLGLE